MATTLYLEGNILQASKSAEADPSNPVETEIFVRNNRGQTTINKW